MKKRLAPDRAGPYNSHSPVNHIASDRRNTVFAVSCSRKLTWTQGFLHPQGELQ